MTVFIRSLGQLTYYSELSEIMRSRWKRQDSQFELQQKEKNNCSIKLLCQQTKAYNGKTGDLFEFFLENSLFAHHMCLS